MRHAPGPLSVSILCAIVSVVVGFVSFGALRREDDLRRPRLGSVKAGVTTYTIQDARKRSSCVGAGTLTLSNDGLQMILMVKGWASLALWGNQVPAKIDGQMVFNAMGQLTVSVLKTSIGPSEITMGTLGINPISFRVFRGSPDSPSLFEQTFPGPIELRDYGGKYELSAPASSLLPVITSNSQLQLPLIVEASDASNGCNPDKADAFDLDPSMQRLGALSATIRNAMRPF